MTNIPPRVTVITLGVISLARSLEFYRDKLGWPTDSKLEDGVAGDSRRVDIIVASAFFQMNGMVLSLFPRQELAKDAGVSRHAANIAPAANSTTNFGESPSFSLAQNVGSPEEVDALLATAEAAGAKILKPGQKVFWGGYSGYFADPDGYLWEVAHNPFWKMDGDGKVSLK